MRFTTGDRWLAAATLAGFGVVALAARAHPASLGPDAAAGEHGAPRGVTTSVPPPVDNCSTPPLLQGRSVSIAADQPAHCHHPNDHTSWVPWSFLHLMVASLVLLSVIALVVALVPRLPRWRRSRPRRARARPVELAPDDLVREVSRTLASTMSQLAGGQIRDGVILCWHRLEQTAEAAGLRRSPAETSSELAEKLLATLPLSEAPLNRLAALYREARFSSHPIPAAAVDQARADLAQLRAELEAAAAGGLPARAGHG
ncbi:MAG TPA: DUF4129 domain-containing protein [Jatrophihabitans sp.]|nr:DUF4129 domain-containing protein [Jatrophihabitans sp.]